MKKAVLLILIALGFILFTSCRTIERIEYVDKYHTIERSDTLIKYDKDSIFVNQFTKGDTVFHVKYIEKIRFKDKIVIQKDTIREIETISRTEIKEVVPGWCYKSIIALILTITITTILVYFLIIKRK